MLKHDELAVKASALRTELSDLAAIPAAELTTEQRARVDAARKELSSTETEFRAAMAERDKQVSETEAATPDAEHRERLQLRAKAMPGRFLEAAMRGKNPEGAEAEYAAAERVSGGIPLALLAAPETRADAVTGAPATTGRTMTPPIQAVFPDSVFGSLAARLGIAQPMVPSGSFNTARLTTSLTADFVAKGAAQDSTAAAFTQQDTTPHRVAARLSLSWEDLASVGIPAWEESLRENLRLVLANKLDSELIQGPGTGNRLTGLIQRLTAPADPAAVAKFDDWISAMGDAIDGLFAGQLADLVAVIHPGAFKLANKTFRDAGTTARGAESVVSYLRREMLAFFTSATMPAAASNIAQGIAVKRGMEGVQLAVSPMWNSVSVDDIFSDAASGQRHLTLGLMVGDVLLRYPAAYARFAVKIA